MISNDYYHNRVNSAYTSSTAFDEGKKRDAEEVAKPAVAKDTYEGAKKEKIDEEQNFRFEAKRENGITFKSGFAFVYGKKDDIDIAIHSPKKIKIKSDSPDIEIRKPIIKEIVGFAMGVSSLENLNDLFKENQDNLKLVKEELIEMGLNPEKPFGLGLEDFYFQQNEIYQYKKMDLSA